MARRCRRLKLWLTSLDGARRERRCTFCFNIRARSSRCVIRLRLYQLARRYRADSRRGCESAPAVIKADRISCRWCSSRGGRNGFCWEFDSSSLYFPFSFVFILVLLYFSLLFLPFSYDWRMPCTYCFRRLRHDNVLFIYSILSPRFSLNLTVTNTNWNYNTHRS